MQFNYQMGTDCDLCITNGCLKRTTWSIRYFIILNDIKDINFDNDHSTLHKIMSCYEGMCIDCFFILKTEWFDKITPIEIVPNEEFINDIGLVAPDFKYGKITYKAIYSNNAIKQQVAFDILNEYEHNYSKYHSNVCDRQIAICKMIERLNI